MEEHCTAKRLFAVGAYVILGDIMYIEVLADVDDEKKQYYRLTTLGDEGYTRGTWERSNVPETVLKLVELLVSLGSEVRDGILYGPHLSRSLSSLRDIEHNLHVDANDKVYLHVDDEMESELTWLSRYLE